MQTLACHLICRSSRAQYPPGPEQVVGDKEERRIATVAFMQSHPREIQARNRQFFVEIEPIQPTAHYPQILATAVGSLTRRKGGEPDAAAFAVVEGE
ncbi:MAG: hypothetical protein KAX62_10030, partial [Xylophilus sp.]|nr:hypothetical protein [Xylophilus sp.]